MLDSYQLREGDALELEQTRDGILIRPLEPAYAPGAWASAYREMAEEAAERSEWEAWDGVATDGADS